MGKSRRTRSETLEQRVERRFQEVKRRDKVKQRYGVFTQGMLEDLFEKTLTIKLASFLAQITPIFVEKEDISGLTTKEDLRKLDNKLDWLITAYKKFDEEQTLLSNSSANHEDRLEVIEKRFGITV